MTSFLTPFYEYDNDEWSLNFIEYSLTWARPRDVCFPYILSSNPHKSQRKAVMALIEVSDWSRWNIISQCWMPLQVSLTQCPGSYSPSETGLSNHSHPPHHTQSFHANIPHTPLNSCIHPKDPCTTALTDILQNHNRTYLHTHTYFSHNVHSID
jgi:hypothetical protein